MVRAARAVLTKQDFVKRYALGEFGNRSPTWETFDEFVKCVDIGIFTNNKKYHLRNREAGGTTFYNQTAYRVYVLWKALGSGWYCSEMAPEHDKLFQGEVYRSPQGLSLTYNTLPLPMREGMAQGMKHANNTEANVLLKHFMDGNSYDWLQHLLDTYDNHIVEFSTYSEPWGSLYPLYNTVFWEVRNY